MSIAMLEEAAVLLGELTDELAFLGGATVGLWTTDPAAPAPRTTQDVDALVAVSSRAAYREVEVRLGACGFRHDIDSGVTCRFRHRETALILDVIPTEPAVLGLRGAWQTDAFRHAVTHALPSGRTIRVIAPAYLLATKLEAFGDRGHGDFVASEDFADIVSLLDGREELATEVQAAGAQLAAYVAEQLSSLSADRRFLDGLHANVSSDAASQGRVQAVLLPRIRALRALSPPP